MCDAAPRKCARLSRASRLPVVFLLGFGFACGSESAAPDPGTGGSAGVGGTAVGGTGGVSATGGGAGVGGSGGVSATGGMAGAHRGGAAGTGSSGAGNASGGASGQSGSAGAAGNAAGGGAGGSAGAATGGTGAGGSSTGGAGSGGAGGMGGLGGAGATSGAGGAPPDVASALDGLRVDAPCTGTPTTENGAVCNHVMLTSNGGFESAKSVTIAGTPGTVYDVTLRIRGIVEPTNIGGGMRSDTTTFQYQGMAFRTVPFTIGGSVQSPDYSQWHVDIESPAQELYLNDYQKSGHYIFELDYEITVPMAAATTVTLHGTDSNEREIVNYEDYAPEGIPGSMNHGQFIQIGLVSVEPRSE